MSDQSKDTQIGHEALWHHQINKLNGIILSSESSLDDRFKAVSILIEDLRGKIAGER